MATDELRLGETQKYPHVEAGSKYKFVARTQKYKGYFDPKDDIPMRLARFFNLVRPTKQS